MSLTRRSFIGKASAFTLGFAGLQRAQAHPAPGLMLAGAGPGFGPLEADPDGLLELPRGFSYEIISRVGDTMDDGLTVPHKPDGMAAFEREDGMTVLLRNHEIEWAHQVPGAFGQRDELIGRVDRSMLYDAGDGTQRPCLGGVTAVTYDTKTGRVVDQRARLLGTERNCAGGPTPRETWITCEETVSRKGKGFEKDHGWTFEIPALTDPDSLVRPVPLKAMGRFNHEAVATNPKTGIIYQSEDRRDGVLYRFIPNDPNRLTEGGDLEALRVIERPRLDTSNKPEAPTIQVGRKVHAEWVRMDDVESPDDSLRHQAWDKGCTRFARGEGMWYGNGAVYFAATSGGRTGKGQLFRYTPAPHTVEGTPDEASAPGTLELFCEPNDANVLEHADNLTVSPWGDLIVCEDGFGHQHLLGVTPKGEVYTFARNVMNSSEMAGATFSPDGTTLFVNVQHSGLTLAIRGPWRR